VIDWRYWEERHSEEALLKKRGEKGIRRLSSLQGSIKFVEKLEKKTGNGPTRAIEK